MKKLRGGRPENFGDPDQIAMDNMTPEERKNLLKAWESAKPKFDPKFGKALVYGTSNSVTGSEYFKKLWNESIKSQDEIDEYFWCWQVEYWNNPGCEKQCDKCIKAMENEHKKPKKL